MPSSTAGEAAPHYRLHSDPSSSHQQIAQILRRLRPATILDVGAAQGLLGQTLREDSFIIDAIEPNREWAERARSFYRTVIAAPIEQADIPRDAYDAIVCADVLEHLVDPRSVLLRLRASAKDGALFIISLPNFAHLSIRLMLLFGKLPQMDRGILDRTHLHAYTRDTAEDLIRSAGLRIESVSATPVPLEEIFPAQRSSPSPVTPREGRGGGLPRTALFKTARMLQNAAVRIAPRLFAFQWIFVARKS